MPIGVEPVASPSTVARPARFRSRTIAAMRAAIQRARSSYSPATTVGIRSGSRNAAVPSMDLLGSALGDRDHQLEATQGFGERHHLHVHQVVGERVVADVVFAEFLPALGPHRPDAAVAIEALDQSRQLREALRVFDTVKD